MNRDTANRKWSSIVVGEVFHKQHLIVPIALNIHTSKLQHLQARYSYPFHSHVCREHQMPCEGN